MIQKIIHAVRKRRDRQLFIITFCKTNLVETK
jgi:hypothetical protein